MKASYTFKFQVSGAYLFPLDMLRYERCTFDGESDARTAQRSIEHQGTPEQFTVALIKQGARADWYPTVGRWQSFGWQVHVNTMRSQKEMA